VIDVPGEALGWRATRPRFSALGSTRGYLLPPLEHALHRYREQRVIP
jgi:dTDP-4-dehydrorhamnose reductase